MKGKKPYSANFAIFGDIHGRVALMYTLARMWEQQTGESLRAILQVGDMGAYPEHSRLDRATLKHAKRDPDELTYANFCYRSEEGERYLGTVDVPPAYFIRGNHEDFDYLSGFSKTTAIDPWERLFFVPDGEFVDLLIEHTLETGVKGGDTESGGRVLDGVLGEAVGQVERGGGAFVRVGGFGGIHPREAERGRGKKARKAHRERLKRRYEPKYFDPDDVGHVFSSVPSMDILMTHEGPEANCWEHGSWALARLAERVEPRWHFFGHHHVVLGPSEGPGGSALVGLEHLDFDRNGALQESAWGILRMSEEEASFTFATRASFSWLGQVHRETYRQLWEI